MSLRLPPRYYNTPTHARFRKHRLPPELWDTWELLNAISWVNDYKFTPPTPLSEMAAFLTVKPDALRDRLARLQKSGWLMIDPRPGRENVYTPIVPPDVADSCGKPASLIRGCGEDSSGTMESDGYSDLAPKPGIDVPSDTPVVDYRGPYSTVVVAVGTDLPNSEESVPTTTTSITPVRARTKEERRRIRYALWDLGIESTEAQDKILGDESEIFRGGPRDYSHVTPEYVEDWLAHYREVGQRANLGGGYYRMQIREKRESSYEMSATGRAEYRAQNDAEWAEKVRHA